MAKKDIKNVVIKDEELIPTTIGIYSNKTKNPIGLIFLIAIFISIAVFLPDIQNYLNKAMGKTDSDSTSYNNNNGNNKNDDNKNTDDNKVDNKKYDLSSTGNIDTSEYSLNDIKLNGNSLSFKFVNKTKASFDLSNYYLEFYTSDNTFVGRVKVSNDTIELNDSDDFVFTIPANSSLFSFDKKTINDYPKVTLAYDENQEAKLICKNNDKRYTYQFVDDQLVRILHTYITNNTVANYYDIYTDYQNKYTNYSLIDGVTAGFSETVSDFTFSLNVDLSKADISKIADDNMFKIKTSPSEVKFIAEAQGLTCSQE